MKIFIAMLISFLFLGCAANESERHCLKYAHDAIGDNIYEPGNEIVMFENATQTANGTACIPCLSYYRYKSGSKTFLKYYNIRVNWTNYTITKTELLMKSGKEFFNPKTKTIYMNSANYTCDSLGFEVIKTFTLGE